MTRQRDLKTRIRARMKKTGERYTSARAQILQQSSTQEATAHFPGVLDGYDRFGGVQGETAILQNVLRHSSVTHPANSEPYSETMTTSFVPSMKLRSCVPKLKTKRR